MREGPISALLEEVAREGMRALEASLKHLEFFAEGMVYKFDKFAQDAGFEQIYDERSKRMVNMADYYHKSGRRVNGRLPAICSTGTFSAF